MKHFLIYTNPHQDKDLKTSKHIEEALFKLGATSLVTLALKNEDRKPDFKLDVDKSIDCIIVLGGDGTILQAARETKTLDVAIIGVNMGTLGYMSEIELSALDESLERLVKDDYTIEERMMLNGKKLKEGKSEEGWALNDIVISRAGSLAITKIEVCVNGQFLNEYNADGMIITTPTGSTGYNLSAGGPLVEPAAKLIVMTPICPHSLTQRSIVLSPEDVIEIVIPEGRDGSEQTLEASFDGTHRILIKTGDKLRIVKSEKVTKFVRLNRDSFMEKLHRKMKEV